MNSIREEVAKRMQFQLSGNADNTKADAIQTIIKHHLKGIAIGVWVSVDERLPEAPWEGITMWSDGGITTNEFYSGGWYCFIRESTRNYSLVGHQFAR